MPPGADQRLWTIQITGGLPFTFQAAGNPVVEHEGGTSVAHLVLNESEVGELKILAAFGGCAVKAWPMGGQTESQTEERARLNRLGEERGWPTPMCPSCPWFSPLDPAHRDVCGLRSLPEEAVAILRETSEAHVKAEKSCTRLSDS